jgi:hypothetical protein
VGELVYGGGIWCSANHIWNLDRRSIRRIS